MNYLSVELISKSYGIKELFSGISFGINKGEKVGLVAKNGTGKSTLLKTLARNETPDEGNIVFRKGITIAYLSQEQNFDASKKIEDVIYMGDNPKLEAIKAYNKCIANNIQGPEMEEAFEAMNEQQAWEYENSIKQILSQLKLNDLQQSINNLSGGQLKRLALAKVLVNDPDFMILDEPTNHLDLEMIEWLEKYLQKSTISLLMVTHDRYFLENVCDTILELDQGNLYRYQGNYSYFIEKKAQREEEQIATIGKAKNLMRKELEWMRRMPKARGTKSKSRIDAFYQLKATASQRIKKEELELNINMQRLGSKTVELHKVSKAFGDLKILDGYNYNFKRGEKIGIVGKNGVGKSTFLDIVTGSLPVDSGKVVIGETITFGYYKQEGLKLDEDRRVIEVVKDIAEVIPVEGGRKISASQFLQRFMFPPKMQYQYVSTLSGGEKRRLFLLTVLMKNPNFLILDEPTNDLDINTMNVLEEYLEYFKGCLIVVSHDRYFMDKIVDHLFVFQGAGKIKEIQGSYSIWLSQQKQDDEQAKKETKASSPTSSTTMASKNKMGFNEKREFGRLEVEIEKLEKRKKELDSQISDPDIAHEELIKVSEELGKIIEEIEQKTDRWLELSELQ